MTRKRFFVGLGLTAAAPVLLVAVIFIYCLLDDFVLRPGDGQWEFIVSDLAFHHSYCVMMDSGQWSTGQSDRIIRLFPPGIDNSFYDPSKPVRYREWTRRIRWK